jgi:hypothetical protein
LEDLRELVLARLAGSSQCYGHCQEQASLRFLEGQEVGAFVCPSGYVSRLILYGLEVDAVVLETLVRSAVGDSMPVRTGDIRLATRYSLDLGLGGPPRRVIREAYWTQNYGKSKNREADRAALFMCSSCSDLFVQPVTANSSLCRRCSR